DPVHSVIDCRIPIRPVRFAVRADPYLPDHPDPVLDLAADGLFQDHPVRTRGVCAHRRRQPLADPDEDRAAARNSRADLGLYFLLYAVLERIIYALTFLSTTAHKTVP